jgi:hypothetical protein
MALEFAASLHPLSIAAALRASAGRTPGRAAVVQDGNVQSYGELLAALPATRAVEDAGERALILRALDNIVVHAAFDRDEPMATTLPGNSGLGAVAAAAAIVLGCTLHRIGSRQLVAGIAAGDFTTCWIDDIDVAAALPAPAARFRLALTEREPSPQLAAWLGTHRVARAV